ncbi:MAG: 50S ribosomal protein L28, partial [Chloroflexota bacterium]|nr:50S ribosomal protein L28 [Chloroflexota bacterium]
MRSTCDICGKRSMAGSNVSHSKRHTKRRFMPNIQKVTLPLAGRRVGLSVCTRCLRTLYRAPR